MRTLKQHAGDCLTPGYSPFDHYKFQEQIHHNPHYLLIEAVKKGYHIYCLILRYVYKNEYI
jgi:hypothetical protein